MPFLAWFQSTDESEEAAVVMQLISNEESAESIVVVMEPVSSQISPVVWCLVKNAASHFGRRLEP